MIFGSPFLRRRGRRALEKRSGGVSENIGDVRVRKLDMAKIILNVNICLVIKRLFK